MSRARKALAIGTFGPASGFTFERTTTRLGRIEARAPPLWWKWVAATTGGFVLIDEATNATVAAGMLLDPRS